MMSCGLSEHTYTVSFFGHRIIEDPLVIEKRLKTLIRRLLGEKEYVAFLVGRDGEFDQIVSSSILCCKREYRGDNSAHIWVLPYPTADFRDNEDAYRAYYDEIEVSQGAAGGYFKAAYQMRNREMVDRSDLVVFCVQHERGGAWQTMKYAVKQGTPYINIHDFQEGV